jgi:hypothetical protein
MGAARRSRPASASGSHSGEVTPNQDHSRVPSILREMRSGGINACPEKSVDASTTIVFDIALD